MSTKPDTLVNEAQSLIRRALQVYHPVYGFSTTTCQVYDTAWVAMISKNVDGEKKWLFPESFEFLLRTQDQDGSWGKHPNTKTVGILDTAAALLALLRHAKEPLQIKAITTTDLEWRIDQAVNALRLQLTSWDDILTTNHIGVELIVPALLAYLESENHALTFNFQSKEMLMCMHEAKMKHFNPESLYQKQPSSGVHSLEAFISKIDFDRVGHHLFNGSMLASPSSTAAFLIYASSWSDEAEAYLQHVFIHGAGQGAGGIPGTHPTTYFEFNWVLSTLLQAGFSSDDLTCDELISITNIIVEGFQKDRGVIGFAPRACDVDDTAKGLLTLSLLHLDDLVSPIPMIKLFECDEHFQTFAGERDASFTSNCHVLLALLHRSDKLQYRPKIRKAAVFLCNSWWNYDGTLKDKWHLSHLYPTMLLSQAFTDLLYQIDTETEMGELFDAEMLSKMSICIFQACFRTIKGQDKDGSWNGNPEETSYAILVLIEARRLAFFENLQPQITAAIDQGKAFLNTEAWTLPDHNWTSKTAYRTPFVAEAYLLAARRGSLPRASDAVGLVGRRLASFPLLQRMDGLLQLVRQTDILSSMPLWEIQASFVESAMFISLLRAHRLSVYDRDHMGCSRDDYIDIIPFTWVVCNNRSRVYVATSLSFEMMIISMLGYQTDEFMEAIAAPAFAQNTGELHDMIDNIIDEEVTVLGSGDKEAANNRLLRISSIDVDELSDRNESAADFTPAPDSHGTAMIQGRNRTGVGLRRFVHYVLGHLHVRNANPREQLLLQHELRAFLHAHAVQIQDNANNRSSRPTRAFFDWVRTTAADHVACAYSFAFARCLVSALVFHGQELFATVKEDYLIRAAVRHMATMCRMSNDFGSVDRDLAEGNINSVDFSEFIISRWMQERKMSLLGLAKYEHSCLLQTLGQLEKEVFLNPKPLTAFGDFRKRKMDFVRFYADVTDFYDQLYVVRDLSSTLHNGGDCQKQERDKGL